MTTADQECYLCQSSRPSGLHWLDRIVGRFWLWRYWTVHGRYGHYSLRTHKLTLRTQCKGDGFLGDGRWHNLDYSRSWEREEIEAAIAANGRGEARESASV